MSATITRLSSDSVRACGATACGEPAVVSISVRIAERYPKSNGIWGTRHITALVVPSCAPHASAVRDALREVEA